MICCSIVHLQQFYCKIRWFDLLQFLMNLTVAFLQSFPVEFKSIFTLHTQMEVQLEFDIFLFFQSFS